MSKLAHLLLYGWRRRAKSGINEEEDKYKNTLNLFAFS